jgi:hypothetical protein
MAKAELKALGRELDERLPALCFPSLYGEGQGAATKSQTPSG